MREEVKKVTDWERGPYFDPTKEADAPFHAALSSKVLVPLVLKFWKMTDRYRAQMGLPKLIR
jgi:hypothetical protein